MSYTFTVLDKADIPFVIKAAGRLGVTVVRKNTDFIVLESYEVSYADFLREYYRLKGVAFAPKSVAAIA